MGSWYWSCALTTPTVQERKCEPEEYDWQDSLETYDLSNSFESALTENSGSCIDINGRRESFDDTRVSLHTLEQRARRLGKGKTLLYGTNKSNHRKKSVEHLSDTSTNEGISTNPQNDPAFCSSCTSQRREQKHKPYGKSSQVYSGQFKTTMDGIERMGMVERNMEKRGSFGNSHSKLKTVSILDTLSEINETFTSQRDKYDDSCDKRDNCENCSKMAPNIGPPVPSDFQHYSEQIYDAMTQKSSPKCLLPSFSSYKLKSANTQLAQTLQTSTPQKADCYNYIVNSSDHFGKKRSTGRDRGRTPDWIQKIFEIAKKGELQSMKEAISGMEDTLVRNLSDHSGNNLLHVMAVFGHLPLLAWLLTSQSILLDGLQDENKYGLTPLMCAIKFGRLKLVQWLVENTPIKDKVRCKDGERSLLHIAAKYAQEEITSWLVDHMMTHEISLDSKDHMGNTALHLVARKGNLRICSLLLQNGADVTLKNDLGQNASEICIMKGHKACAEYLCVHEAGLSLASDVTTREAELEASNADNEEIRLHFKEVMSIARRLLREKDDAVRDLSKLHEHMVETHDSIIVALQVLAEENTSLRDKLNGVRLPQQPREQVENVIEYVTGLHKRWQTARKTWFGSSLVNMKHRMLKVEEGWKKLKQRNHRTVASTHHPLDIFRVKLGNIRDSSRTCRFGDLPSLYHSDESLSSQFPFSDDEENVKDVGIHNDTIRTNNIEMNGELNSSTLGLQLVHSEVAKGLSKDVAEDVASDILSSMETSQFKIKKSNDATKASYYSDLTYIDNFKILSDVIANEHSHKDDISAKLKDLGLTSESGSCSVVEVIEPSCDDLEVSDEMNYLQSPTNKKTPKQKKGIHEGEKKTHYLKNDSNHKSLLQEATISSEGMRDWEPQFLTANATSSVDIVGNISELERRVGGTINEQDHSTVSIKRKGFLQKFIKQPKWPANAKKKSKNIKRADSVESQDIEIQSPLPEISPSTSRENKMYPELHTPTEKLNHTSDETSLSPKLDLYEPYLNSEKFNVNLIVNHNQIETEVNSACESSQFCSTNDATTIDSPPQTFLQQRLLSPPSSTQHSPREFLDAIQARNFSSSNSLKKIMVPEVCSVSEESNMVNRPASSASKFESVSRPESSSPHFSSLKHECNHQRSTLSLTQEMLSPDSSNAGRMSPAPSEVSKTESALSPPSQVSDLSKSESTRQARHGKLTVENSSNSEVSHESPQESQITPITIQPLRSEEVKTATIMEIPNESTTNKLSLGSDNQIKEEDLNKMKAWYEVSDEESDMLLPDCLKTKLVPASLSSEEEC